MRKITNTDNLILDVHFEQFSEEDDLPEIEIHNGADYYDFSPDFYKDEIKRLRKDAQWLLKSADYIEHTYNSTKQSRIMKESK